MELKPEKDSDITLIESESEKYKKFKLKL